MINVLRKNQKGLWIVIALLCVPFVFYFSRSDPGRIVHNELGQIYGRTVSQVEFQRNARLLNLARDLGMFSYLQEMVAGATSENEAYVDFTWNHIILHHEAERLGIVPTAGEVAKVVKGLTPFRGDKGFDLEKYNQFTQALPASGFGETQIEELASDQLVLEKLKELVGSGAAVSEAEKKENFEQAYGKLNVAVVRVRTEDLAKGVQISDDDVAKYYEAHKAELQSEERRRVAFVSFALDEAQAKLAGKERVEVLQKLADRANDFNQALLEKGAQFEAAAAKFQLPIQNTEFFTRTKPDPLLASKTPLVEAAFRLRTEEPNTDAIQVGDGFHVVHLGAVEEPHPLSLEEAKPKIIETLKNQRTRELVAAKGAEAVQKIREALKAGTPVDAALQQTGLPTEKIPPFALAEPAAMNPTEPGKPPAPEAPDMQTIRGAVAEMHAGEATDFIPTEAGGVVAVLEKRDPPDPAKETVMKAMFASRVLQNKKEIAFFEWMRARRRDAGVQSAVEKVQPQDAG